MTREEMEIYLDHFNNKRYDEVVDYFADDVTVQYPNAFLLNIAPGTLLRGKNEFIENYKTFHENVEEYLDLEDFIADEKYVFIILHTEFIAKEDLAWEDGILEKGKAAVVSDFISYELDDEGKFKKIKIAHHKITYPGGDEARHTLSV